MLLVRPISQKGAKTSRSLWKKVGLHSTKSPEDCEPQTHATLDAHGSRLTSASLPGDGFRQQHDAIKWRLDEDLHEMGLRVRTEIYGLFAAALPQHVRHDISRWPRRKRQGLVPDFTIALPELGQSPGDANDELFELKTLHFGTSTYPPMEIRAVNRRAEAIPTQTANKANQFDRR